MYRTTGLGALDDAGEGERADAYGTMGLGVRGAATAWAWTKGGSSSAGAVGACVDMTGGFAPVGVGGSFG